MNPGTDEQAVTPKTPKNTFSQHVGMFFFHVFEKCLTLAPMTMLCQLGRFTGWLAYWLLPSRRRIVRRNIRIVMGTALRGKELDQLVMENFKRTLANMLGSMKTATLTDEQLSHYVRLDHPEVFTAGLRKNKGTVCCIPHSGNWEILARVRTFFREVEHYGSMYRQMDNPLIEEYLYKRRTERGTQMFSKESGIQAPLHFLREKGSLGVLCDQYLQEGVFVPYFRKVAGTTYLPALMYKRTKAAMIAVGVYTERLGHWIADMGEPIDPQEVDSSVPGITIAVNRKVEEIVKRSPLDGFWMHHRWKVYKAIVSTDIKTNALLQGMDLIPFRILLAPPKSWEETLLAVPLAHALKAARSDMQVIVVCAPKFAAFWRKESVVDKVVTFRSANELSNQLNAPALYDDGPYDMAVLLDDSCETVRGLLPFRPLAFSGFAEHPYSRKYRFRTRNISRNSISQSRMLMNAYLELAKFHAVPCEDPSLFPALRKTPLGNVWFLAPFSNRTQGCWSNELWGRLSVALGGECRIIATNDRSEEAERLGRALNLSVVVGEPDSLIYELEEACGIVAVDGLFSTLATYVGVPTVVMAEEVADKRYEPYGNFHEILCWNNKGESLSVEAVASTCKKLLERLRPSVGNVKNS